jgi:hypothetical protein
VLTIPSLTAEHVAEEFSHHDAVDATPTVELLPRSPEPPVDAENSHSAAISLDIKTQGPTDIPQAPTIFLASNSESDPLPASTAFTPTHHPPPSSHTTDIPLSSFPAPVSSDTLPENPQQSFLASPVFYIDEVIAIPGLFPSTSAGAIPLTPPRRRTSFSHPPNDGSFDIDRAPDLSDIVEVSQR